jgi:hypothetical protein
MRAAALVGQARQQGVCSVAERKFRRREKMCRERQGCEWAAKWLVAAGGG